jgi:DNA mismatch repair protein MLH3
MSRTTSRIEPLPPDVIAKLKSSTSITQLNGVIVELVKNALDANAHTIYVTVDFPRGGCVVEDDGAGIPREEFEPGGGLGRAHHSSKLHAGKAVYGRKGLFLASLSSLSLLTITSHHIRQSSTNAIIFHRAAPVARLTPAPVQQELRFRAHGTSITVNDLFGNMPVRVKSRSLALQKPDELDRQWEELKHLIVSVMIANDGLTKLVLSDARKERRLNLSPRPSRLWRDGELDVRRFASILTQAGLVDVQSPDRWDTVSACVPDLSIHAAICLSPSPTKKVQFISIGINPVYPRNNANLLYNEINRLFASSDFGTGAANNPNPGGTSVAKNVNRWPMFYIRIDMGGTEIKDSDEEIPESDKSIQRILDVLGAMVSEFLAQHHLRPCAGKRRQGPRKQDPNTLPASETTSRRLDYASSTEEALGDQVKMPAFQRSSQSQYFKGWSRIKSAKELINDQSAGRARSNGSQTEVDLHKVGTTASVESDEDTSAMQEETDTMIPWTDPYTGRTHLIDSRTGQSTTKEPGQRPHSTGSLWTSKSLDKLHRPRSAVSNTAHNAWVQNVLSRWENPVFSRAEQPISVFDSGQTNPAEGRPGSTSGDLCGFEDFGLSRFRGKLHRQDLDTAEVIAQIDQKFILARLRPSSPSEFVLVLIDQHAADERCRVERLFGEFFADDRSGRVQTITVDPIVLEVAKNEASLFGRYREFFKCWGVEFTLEQGADDRSAAIVVSTLPSLIAERCRVEPNLITDLIRGEIWTREETRRGPFEAATSGEGLNWATRMNGCPKGIVDLLNSRACRTAIMFNDALAVNECQRLVMQLARCLFPFQCAHGRPSMIPILDSSGAGDEPEKEYMQDQDFIEAFRQWKH